MQSLRDARAFKVQKYISVQYNLSNPIKRLKSISGIRWSTWGSFSSVSSVFMHSDGVSERRKSKANSSEALISTIIMPYMFKYPYMRTGEEERKLWKSHGLVGDFSAFLEHWNLMDFKNLKYKQIFKI